MDADLLTVARAMGPSVALAGSAAMTKSAHASQGRGFVLLCEESFVNADLSAPRDFSFRAAKDR
ncbi:MAG: hypothetical protein AUH15_10325 [Acidobacteriales bacterium 13_2_20CM_55_8]|nr:MAG: hypothetical protein AUH15_10325 [Acidobacteriales bacterium 13_2_20CM_55_8]